MNRVVKFTHSSAVCTFCVSVILSVGACTDRHQPIKSRSRNLLLVTSDETGHYKDVVLRLQRKFLVAVDENLYAAERYLSLNVQLTMFDPPEAPSRDATPRPLGFFEIVSDSVLRIVAGETEEVMVATDSYAQVRSRNFRGQVIITTWQEAGGEWRITELSVNPVMHSNGTSERNSRVGAMQTLAKQ